jgi:TetR/AcrR family transcriptional regulator, regulator of cefoperazone and chloramphenicol sensitivity
MATDNARARILEAAGPVFAEHGYEAATVREICEKAEVNLAGVNYYFGGKERLYVETLQRAHTCLAQQGKSPHWPAEAPPVVKLKCFIHSLLAHLLRMRDEPWETRLMTREIMNPTPAGRKLLQEHFRRSFDELQRILVELLPPQTPAHRRHQIGLSIVGQCVYYHAAKKIIPMVIGEEELKQHFGIDELAEHISQLSLAALGLAPVVTGPDGLGTRTAGQPLGDAEQQPAPKAVNPSGVKRNNEGTRVPS